ncbi:hypothetical protein CEXT_575731 [Caerostris extrusa]|uniref:Uncharacterized protein n=1 Tax=Caerostris extrusa TaxID=172846 RepID=A0AAV4XLX5_CAEEX|nr:hypothetical protein CEXT_575731 [Caerostris extrusa]
MAFQVLKKDSEHLGNGKQETSFLPLHSYTSVPSPYPWTASGCFCLLRPLQEDDRSHLQKQHVPVDDGHIRPQSATTGRRLEAVVKTGSAPTDKRR